MIQNSTLLLLIHFHFIFFLFNKMMFGLWVAVVDPRFRSTVKSQMRTCWWAQKCVQLIADVDQAM